MKEKYKKIIRRIKRSLRRKSPIGYNESNVTNDWLKALGGSVLLGVALICVGGYLFLFWQQPTNQEEVLVSVKVRTYDSIKLKNVVSQYQVLSLQFIDLRENPPSVPSVGAPLQTSELVVDSEELLVDESDVLVGE